MAAATSTLSPLPWTDVLIILALVAANGFFAMSEMALVASRRSRLLAMERNGSRGASASLKLYEDLGRFLSTVQIGISLINVVAGAYSGASLAAPVGERLLLLGVPASNAQTLGFVVVIGSVTYVNLVAGELVPKQFALRSPERTAALVGVPMTLLARAASPLIRLLDASSGLVFRLLGMRREDKSILSREDLQLAVAEASRSGVIEEGERAMISGVVRLSDRPVREVMTPRTAIDWVDVDAGLREIQAALAATQRSRLLVAKGSIDRVVGVADARDLLASLLKAEAPDLRSLSRPLRTVPDRLDAMDALGALRRSDVPLAMVHDEYGAPQGLVTPKDLLAAMAGKSRSDRQGDDGSAVVEREAGGWLVDGSADLTVLAERLGLIIPDDRDFTTAAGYALSILRRLPHEGERFEAQGFRFEVVEMAGRKIVRLLIEPAATTERLDPSMRIGGRMEPSRPSTAAQSSEGEQEKR